MCWLQHPDSCSLQRGQERCQYKGLTTRQLSVPPPGAAMQLAAAAEFVAPQTTLRLHSPRPQASYTDNTSSACTRTDDSDCPPCTPLPDGPDCAVLCGCKPPIALCLRVHTPTKCPGCCSAVLHPMCQSPSALAYLPGRPSLPALHTLPKQSASPQLSGFPILEAISQCSNP